ncbi:MAG: DUF3147 family protein [Alphaproteobacteria bacterium]|nr:MAG: DUF3147 family protein [Alphaproteobacteria bacterium]|tara:strand:- start:3577 stop:3927 length:351 start_codon:yes stop_codon:yes gene_type:complete
MLFIFLKVLITSIIIVVVSEIVKINDRVGGLIAALPFTTFLILFWMNFENATTEKISNHMTYTLIYLIATVPMFLIFPICLKNFGFWVAIFFSILVTLVSTLIIHQMSKNFDIKLF